MGVALLGERSYLYLIDLSKRNQPMTKKTLAFQAEVAQLLHLVTHDLRPLEPLEPQPFLLRNTPWRNVTRHSRWSRWS